ncbi:MAG: hypothetical protein RR131_00395 [Anaerovorax sp.]
MWDKFKNDGYTKGLLKKVITVLLIASIALLTFDVLTTSKDGRRQIVDLSGGEEIVETGAVVNSEEELRLMAILKDIKGVGENQVMITYERDEAAASVFHEETDETKNKVEGVIITAEGAKNVVVQNNIIGAVSSLYGIATSKVKVFEKEGGN